MDSKAVNQVDLSKAFRRVRNRLEAVHSPNSTARHFMQQSFYARPNLIKSVNQLREMFDHYGCNVSDAEVAAIFSKFTAGRAFNFMLLVDELFPASGCGCVLWVHLNVHNLSSLVAMSIRARSRRPT